jgi:hypothetical protein
MRDKDWKASRRRTIRIRRLSLLRANLDKIDRPGIKIAETRDELGIATLSYIFDNRLFAFPWAPSTMMNLMLSEIMAEGLWNLVPLRLRIRSTERTSFYIFSGLSSEQQGAPVSESLGETGSDRTGYRPSQV